MGGGRRRGGCSFQRNTYRINGWFYARLRSRGTLRIFTVISDLKTEVYTTHTVGVYSIHYIYIYVYMTVCGPVDVGDRRGLVCIWASRKNTFLNRPVRCDSDKWRQPHTVLYTGGAAMAADTRVVFCSNFSVYCFHTLSLSDVRGPRHFGEKSSVIANQSDALTTHRVPLAPFSRAPVLLTCNISPRVSIFEFLSYLQYEKSMLNVNFSVLFFFYRLKNIFLRQRI